MPAKMWMQPEAWTVYAHRFAADLVKVELVVVLRANKDQETIVQSRCLIIYVYTNVTRHLMGVSRGILTSCNLKQSLSEPLGRAGQSSPFDHQFKGTSHRGVEQPTSGRTSRLCSPNCCLGNPLWSQAPSWAQLNEITKQSTQKGRSSPRISSRRRKVDTASIPGCPSHHQAIHWWRPH